MTDLPMKGSPLHMALGAFDLLVMSAVDWPLMLPKEPLPHWPRPDRWESDGNYYHHAKGFWASLYRADAEYWSKLSRFIIWWLLFSEVVR